MNINFDNNSNTFNMELTNDELRDIRYMLILSFNKLLDDKIFCDSLGSRGNNECIRRCELNLDIREKIGDLFDLIYGEEEEDNG